MKSWASYYTSRGGLTPNDPFFVGREELLRDIFMRLSGPGKNLPGVAVVGPRRSGKTSVLHQLLSPDVRSRYLSASTAWLVRYLDVSRRPWNGFDGFREDVIRTLLGTGPSDRRYSCISDVVTSASEQHGSETVILILDEFSRIAPHMGESEQAELRAAIDNIAGFSVVVGVIQPLDEILEHLPPELLSDLAPVTQKAMPGLTRLEDCEADELVSKARVLGGMSPDPDAARELRERVGTHPLLIHAACYGWYKAVGSQTLRELSPSDRHRAYKIVDAEVEAQWPFVIDSLSGPARVLLTETPTEFQSRAGPRVKSEVLEMGVTAWLERWTASGSGVRGERSDGDLLDPAETLLKRVDEINYRYQLLMERKGLLFRTDRMRVNDRVHLARHIKNQADFEVFVSTLHSLLDEGSGGKPAPLERGKVEARLPSWLYHDDRSVITHLVALRNHFTHFLPEDSALASKYIADVGSLFLLYCGARAPIGKNWDALRVNLLEAANALLTRLNVNLPLAKDLSADHFFQ